MNTYQGRHRTPGWIRSGYKVDKGYEPRHAAHFGPGWGAIRTQYGVGAVTTRSAS